MIELSQHDLEDILYGCTILGSGGGGSLKTGLKLVNKALALGKRFRLVDFKDVPDDAWIATPYMCGSISPITPELEAQYADLPQLEEPLPYLAFKAMESYFGKSFYGVLSSELGGGNTAEAFYVAAMLDKPIIDADPAGRSVPELQHSTYYLYNLPIYPLACANQFGDVIILPEVVNDLRAEALVRALAVASKNSIGVADHPAQAKVLRKAVILGAISYAWKIGRLFREAMDKGIPASRHIADTAGGFFLFRGKVSRFEYDTVEGFTVGDVYIDGEGEYDGQQYHLWFKNEHIIAWRDGQEDVSVPDLICVFDERSNEPNLNPYFCQGMPVSVIGLPAPVEWRSQRGLEIFGPRHFGFDIPYIPIEERQQRA